MTSSSLRRCARRSGVLLAVPGVALTLALTGCGGSSSTEEPAAASTTDAEAAESRAALSLADGWVKAADTGMTAVFGTLVNDGDEDVTLTAGATPVAEMVEMHEMVMGADGAMVMQEKPGGIVVPAGGEHVLKPGGDHIMLLGLTAPVAVGDEVTVTLDTADGNSVEIIASARDFAGADESYVPAGGMDGEGGTGMGSDATQGNG